MLIKSNRVGQESYTAGMREMNDYTILAGKPKGKVPLRRPRCSGRKVL